MGASGVVGPYKIGNAGLSLLLVGQDHYLRVQKSGHNLVLTDDYVTLTEDGFTINHGAHAVDIGFNQRTTCYFAFC